MSKKLLSFSLLTILAALGGCSLLAPDRADPKVDLPEKFTEPGQLVESNLPYIAWWQQFKDPNLNQLIESGLKANTSIAQAEANIQQAQGELRALELSWIPGINAFAGVVNMYPMLPQPQTIYGGFAGYNSINFFSLIAQQKSAKLKLEAKEKALEGAKLDLIANIAISYYTLIAQQAELKLYQQYLTDLQTKKILQQKKHDGGLASAADGLSIDETIEKTISQLKSVENNVFKSHNAINYLLNQNPGTNYPTSDFTQTATKYANLTTTPASVVGNRPDVKVAALQFKYVAQNLTATYTQLLPSFQLIFGPSVVSSGGLPGMPDSSYSNFQAEFINWTLSPSIFGNIEQYKGSEKYSYISYIDTVRKALRDVSNDLATNRITNERYTHTQNANLVAKTKYDYSFSMYKNGLKAYADTLNDKINWDEGQISVNEMKLAQMQAIITLYKDMGGGYRFNESAVVTKVK